MSKAIELAERCENLASIADAYSEDAYRDAAAELRRLDKVNTQLLEASISTLEFLGDLAEVLGFQDGRTMNQLRIVMNAVVAAKEQA
jgi:hypothetical protein